MSKHSKWSKIKNQKAVTDVRKGKIFTKMGRVLAVAARQGGADPATNMKLRLAIDKARAANVPKDTIERAIQKATGGGDGVVLEETLYEGFGPHGIAVLVECLTDNSNRTLQDVRRSFANHGGNLGGAGSVGWMFARRGVIRTTPLPEE
ncbi:YebC/PmpR family DNA-binding transcriptional regulator, partial [Candidatus Uhrbacteria bacterium]|nr:YebC/PmpR family DNA-binding transcriptional regulator [Candidatus Uhrbacteria bacterium]